MAVALQSCIFLNPRPVEVEAVQQEPLKSKPIRLKAASAKLHGDKIQLEGSGKKNIGYWGSRKAWVSWKLQITEPGVYRIRGSFASARNESDLQCEIARQSAIGNISKTASWSKYQVEEIGDFKINQAGEYEIKLVPAKSGLWNGVNLQWIEAIKIKDTP